jgi:hypothetical protein
MVTVLGRRTDVTTKGGWPSRTLTRHWVPLDKNEGVVKDRNIRSVFFGTAFLPERLRTKTLEMEISR